MAWFRRILPLLLVFLVSGCCTTLFNSASNGFLGGSLGIAPDDNDSEPVIGAVYGCDCDNVPGLSTSVAGDIFFPSQGNAFAAHVLARYLFATNLAHA